jgi:phosphoribosyl-AMP cyclohydrolase
MQEITTKEFIDGVKFNQEGLVPAIAQDFSSKEILMLAYMNKESLEKTIEGKRACYWSRSRQSLWLKGETSGHFQYIKKIFLDCDGDTILLQVDQIGPACHTGAPNCFFREVKES